MELEPGGRFAMQLDCNRASGSWEAHATSQKGGSMALGHAAVTSAACLDPKAMDARIAQDLESIRAYALDGDHLKLTLQAGGVYTWRRLAQ
jgi:heat shock protein HslJ